MAGRPLKNRQNDELSNGKATSGARYLMRRLIRQISEESHNSTEGQTSSKAREIILDIEMDGLRYQLVCSRPEAIQTTVVLSPRETEIARMVAQGYPNKTIAGVLDISSWTVCTHLRRIFSKLGVRSRAAMVARLSNLRNSLNGN